MRSSIILGRIAAAAFALVLLFDCARAFDAQAIEGHYLQNRRCKGDASDPPALKVTIAPHEIRYAGGICSIDSRRAEPSKLVIAVTCKFRSGSILGADIAFTSLGEQSLHMTQQDGTFEADLYRCPD